MKNKSNKNLKFIAIVITLVIVLMGAFYIYTLDYYRADAIAIQTLAEDKTMIENKDKMTIFYADEQLDTGAGLIFYPGGKVEATAYAPLLQKISAEGITCVLVEMPFNLAVFDVKAANKVYNLLPEIQSWYLGGHSLGGAMASNYVENNSTKLEGLILLGAYPINDSNIPTLAIYGSEDKGLDITKLAETNNKFEIAGGNHAYFGDYGEQKGDGIASITREEQQSITVEKITEFIQGIQ